MNFTRFVPTPENRAALAAVQSVVACVCSERAKRTLNPLYLHGLPGTGKTHLMSELVAEVTRRMPRIVVTVQPASEAGTRGQGSGVSESEGASSLTPDPHPLTPDSMIPDLLIVEDLQHLAARRANQAAVIESFVQTFDDLLARQRQMVFTASTGPARIAHLPARLVSRLASGLVVGLEPLGGAGRLALLQDHAQRRQLAVSREVLAWLADHLRGGTRQLLGALLQVEELSRLHSRPLNVAAVAEHFRPLLTATGLTVERIAERVSSCFHVSPRELQSRRRSRSIVMPRQIGMYLARKLTRLSLEQIGAYFGGRDHSTVLHACNKVKGAMDNDLQLSGIVKQLQAELR